MHIFHKWSKWETYTQKGVNQYSSSLGVWVERLENGNIVYCSLRQKRTCVVCGRMQDIAVVKQR